MDRLSAYAERESESEPEEDRKRSEEEATTRLLENLRVSRETKTADSMDDKPAVEQTNGETTNGDKPVGDSSDAPRATIEGDTKQTANDEVSSETPKVKKRRGIPEDVKLYEIFYGQVTHLVHAQRLPIQDTIALLVSLAHLAL